MRPGYSQPHGRFRRNPGARGYRDWREQQNSGYSRGCAVGALRAGRARAAGRSCEAGSDRVRAQPQLGRRDLSDDRAGTPSGLWLRPRGLGVPTRHAVLAAARRHRRVHAARARDRRRAELLPAGHRWGFRLVGVCAGDVLFFLVSPLVRPARRFRRRRGSSICSRTHLFRVPRTDRNRGRPSAGPGLLPAGARLSGELPAATLRGRAAVRAGLLSSSSPRPGGFHNRDLVFMARLAAAASRASP